MRGTDRQQSSMFSYISTERRVPKDHPLRTIRAMAAAALSELGPSFEAIYVRCGRPSVAPEKLSCALFSSFLGRTQKSRTRWRRDAGLNRRAPSFQRFLRDFRSISFLQRRL